jgi:hypothetical protein
MTGRVVDGRIQVDANLEEGTTVAILAADEAAFRLTADQEEELATALADIRSGHFIAGRDLLRELRSTNTR